MGKSAHGYVHRPELLHTGHMDPRKPRAHEGSRQVIEHPTPEEEEHAGLAAEEQPDST